MLASSRTVVAMKPVRGMITSTVFPDGVPRRFARHLPPGAAGQPMVVELIRGTDEMEGPFARPDHPSALGLPVLCDVVDGTSYLVDDLPPHSELRVMELSADDEGREVLDAVVKEGLRLVGSPRRGRDVPQ
jgi:hypothetical protein